MTFAISDIPVYRLSQALHSGMDYGTLVHRTCADEGCNEGSSFRGWYSGLYVRADARVDRRDDPEVKESSDVGHVSWAVVSASLPPDDDKHQTDGAVQACSQRLQLWPGQRFSSLQQCLRSGFTFRHEQVPELLSILDARLHQTASVASPTDQAPILTQHGHLTSCRVYTRVQLWT